MNRKGFTLVELLATITILGIIVTIGGVSISGIIKNAKNEEYKQLVSSIKNAAEIYYQEVIIDGNGGDTTVSLADLLNKGYITGNDSNKKLINPHSYFKDKPSIMECEISLSIVTTGVAVTRITTDKKCPYYYDEEKTIYVK